MLSETLVALAEESSKPREPQQTVPERLLDLLFPDSEKERRISLEFLLEIRGNLGTPHPFTANDGREFCKRNSFSFNTYQKVRARMVSKGLVEKHDEDEAFMISLSFVHNLEKEIVDFLQFHKN